MNPLTQIERQSEMVSDKALGGRACGLVTARINTLACIFLFS